MDKINPLVIPSNSEKDNGGTPSNESPEQSKTREVHVSYRLAGKMKTDTDYFITTVTVPTDLEELSSFPVIHELAERHKCGTAAIELRGHWGDLHRFERDGS